MTARIFSFESGETFEEPTDWVDFVRRALFGLAAYPSFGVNLHYDYDGIDRRFPDLFNALKGTGAEHALADALMRVLETGSPKERFEARRGPYELAPAATARIEALLVEKRADLIEANVFGALLYKLYALENGFETARAIAREELARPDSDEVILTTLDRDFDLFITHLPTYRAQLDPRRWLYSQTEERAQELLDVMMQRADGYAERLRADLTSEAIPADFRARLREQLAAHPVAKALLTP